MYLEESRIIHRQIISEWHYTFILNPYKVLRFKLVIRNFLESPKVSELEVYTLGVDEKWRNADKVHWMDCEKIEM